MMVLCSDEEADGLREMHFYSVRSGSLSPRRRSIDVEVTSLGEKSLAGYSTTPGGAGSNFTVIWFPLCQEPPRSDGKIQPIQRVG